MRFAFSLPYDISPTEPWLGVFQRVRELVMLTGSITLATRTFSWLRVVLGSMTLIQSFRCIWLPTPSSHCWKTPKQGLDYNGCRRRIGKIRDETFPNPKSSKAKVSRSHNL